jgi:tetratricopeptide (TPR) repeat protein
MSEAVSTALLFQQGAEHQRAGRLNDASAAFQRVLAIDPQHADSLYRLGTIALALGRSDIAANLIEAALSLNEPVAAFHNDLGEAYRRLGRFSEAAREFHRTVTLDPMMASAYNNLAIMLQGEGQLDDAILLYRQGIELQPDSFEMQLNLGCALLATDAVEEASAALERAQQLAPDNPTMLLDLGNVRMRQDRVEEAEALYRTALRHRPDYMMAELNLGLALRELGRPADSLPHYDRAALLDPDSPSVKWNDSVCRLLLGDYKRGWVGFAYRWQATKLALQGLTTPTWDGTTLTGKRLLVHAEQGLGDTIQFVRFLPQLAKFGADDIIFLAQAPLLRLLRRAALGCTIVGPEDPMPPYDTRLPLMDLPLRLDITLENLPAKIPYLSAEPDLITAWETRFKPLPGVKVGLVWQGRPDHANDRNRSISTTTLTRLLDLSGMAWVSLQKATIGDVPGGIVDISASLSDMMDTAAAIMALDLVISVDTSVAHLAGALGKPVWLLLPLAPDWRWLVDRDDSPWYPTARLFRQSVRGEWSDVIDQVEGALRGV